MAKTKRRTRKPSEGQTPRAVESVFDDRARAERRWLVTVGAIALGGFVIRLIFFAELHRTPMWWALLSDGQSYDEWGRRIAGGDWIGSEVFYQTPLYPYLLGVLFTIIGHSLGAIRIMQALFGAGSIVLLAIAGRKFFDARVGLIAAAIIALYPEAIFFDGMVQKSSLDLLLMTGLLAAIGAFITSHRRRYLGIAGVVIGAFVLNRENAFVLIPVLAACVFIGYRREPLAKRLTWIGIGLAGVAVMTAPVAIRNYAISREIAISTSQFGPNFYIGNRLGATGTYAPLIPGRENASEERTDAVALAELAAGHSLSPGQVSHYWFTRTLDEIRRAPGSWLRLMAYKLLLVINTGESVDGESLWEDKEYSVVLSVTALHSFGVLMALAAVGVWVTRARWRQLSPLYAIATSLLAAVAVFYVFSRYRYPVVPVLVLFEACALSAIFRRGFAWREWRIPAVILVGVGTAACLPLIKPIPQTVYNVAVRLNQTGRQAEAIQWLERGVALVPDDAITRASLGRLRLESGDVEQAIVDLRAAAKLSPDSAETHLTLGRALTKIGQSDEALRELKTAVMLDPRAGPSRVNYGVALWNAGQKEAAIEQYRESVRLQPDDPIGQNNLALALYQTGHLDEAAAGFEIALKLKSDYPEAQSNLANLLSERGDLGSALKHFEVALGARPNDFGINVNAGDLLMRMNRPGDAAAHYKVALAHSPDSVEQVLALLEHLGEALINDHKGSEARVHLQRGLQLAQAAGQTEAAARIQQAIRRAGG